MINLTYNICYALGMILYLPLVMLRKKWRGNIGERFAYYKPNFLSINSEKPVIWLHAVSVGEVFAVTDFLKRLINEFPNHRIVFSTVTLTGYDIAKQIFPKDVEVILAPLDFSWIVKRAINIIKPELYIAAETELWPLLYQTLKSKQIPIALINGRISDSSYRSYQYIRFILRQTLSAVTVFAMQTKEDAERIIYLGAEPEKVHVLGNLKFQQYDLTKLAPLPEGLRAHQILIAGSTHSGEEEIILKELSTVRKSYPEMRLLITPRHAERAHEVKKIVQSFGMNSVLYSEFKGDWPLNTVIIVDIVGVLRSLYQAATAVFIGKSFVVGGGQNMIEPIFFGKPTFVGPLTQNFKDVVSIFKREGVLTEVYKPEDLGEEIVRVLGDKNLCAKIKTKGPQIVETYGGALERILETVKKIVKR